MDTQVGPSEVTSGRGGGTGRDDVKVGGTGNDDIKDDDHSSKKMKGDDTTDTVPFDASARAASTETVYVSSESATSSASSASSESVIFPVIPSATTQNAIAASENALTKLENTLTTLENSISTAENRFSKADNDPQIASPKIENPSLESPNLEKTTPEKQFTYDVNVILTSMTSLVGGIIAMYSGINKLKLPEHVNAKVSAIVQDVVEGSHKEGEGDALERGQHGMRSGHYQKGLENGYNQRGNFTNVPKTNASPAQPSIEQPSLIQKALNNALKNALNCLTSGTSAEDLFSKVALDLWMSILKWSAWFNGVSSNIESDDNLRKVFRCYDELDRVFKLREEVEQIQRPEEMLCFVVRKEVGKMTQRDSDSGKTHEFRMTAEREENQHREKKFKIQRSRRAGCFGGGGSSGGRGPTDVRNWLASLHEARVYFFALFILSLVFFMGSCCCFAYGRSERMAAESLEAEEGEKEKWQLWKNRREL